MRPTREGRVSPNRPGLIFKGIGVDPGTTDEPADPVDRAELGLAYVPFLPPPDTGAPTDLNLDLGTDYDGGGIRPVVNPTNANDGSLVTQATRNSYFNGGGTDTWWLEADLGAARQVDEIIIRGGKGNSGENDPGWDIEHSPDSSTWTTAAGSYVWNGGTNPRTATLTLTSSQTKRYWRIGESVGPGSIQALKVHTWQIIGPQTVTPSVPVWAVAPLTIDGDDSSYEYAFEDAVDATGGAFWRGYLTDSFLINSLTAEVGFEDAGAVTILVQAGEVEDFSDAATVGTIAVTATGGYTSDSLSATLTSTSGYRYWQLVLDTPAQGVHVYEVNLLEQEAGQTGAELDAHLADPLDAHDASAVSVLDADGWYVGDDVESALAELAAKAIGYQGHGNLGASETFDAAIGQHSGTLDANCTFSLTAAASGTASWLFIELAQNATGGFTIDLPGSVVNAAEVEAEQDTTASETTFLALYSRDGGTTWYGGWWGGGGGTSGAAEDITFTPAGSISATNVQDAIEEVAAEAGSSTVAGRQLIAIPVAANVETGSTLALTTNDAFWSHVNLVAPMKVRGLAFLVQTSNSGALEWGLFDFSSSATAATKVCGGSAATGGTGWRTIAASGAPVDVAAGSYALIFKAPSANTPTLHYSNYGTLDGRLARKQASYSWDDTPDLTTGWINSAGPFTCRLVGDIDGSTQFP